MRYLVNRPGNIFGDFDRILNNLFEDNQQAEQRRSFRTPAVDISENKKGYVLEVELPGLSEKDVEVKIEKNRLLISSLKNEGKESKGSDKDTAFLLRERGSVDFFRTFILPKDADQEKVEAAFSNGILRVSIKKKPEEQAKSIKIKAA